MQVSQIDILLAAIGAYPDSVKPVQLRDTVELDEPILDRFATLYSKPDIGFYLASAYARRNVFFPSVLMGIDNWVSVAWHMNRNPKKFFNPHVAHATALFFDRTLSVQRSIVEALLLAKNGGAGPASQNTGLDRRTLEAYQALFWNVPERLEDLIFIQQMVYPDGRMVEMVDNYFENTSFSSMLLRSAFNYGVDDVMYLAGLGNGSVTLDKLCSRPDIADKMEKYVIGLGYLMARNGLINQRRHAAVISRSVHLLAAAKQSGASTGAVSPFAAVRKSFDSQLQLYREAEIARYQANFDAYHNETRDAKEEAPESV